MGHEQPGSRPNIALKAAPEHPVIRASHLVSIGYIGYVSRPWGVLRLLWLVAAPLESLAQYPIAPSLFGQCIRLPAIDPAAAYRDEPVNRSSLASSRDILHSRARDTQNVRPAIGRKISSAIRGSPKSER